MRKILSFITTTLLLAACTQDKTFVLRGSGLDLPDGTVVGLSSHEMGFEQLGETVVKDGAFELHADITTPVYALLTTNNLNLVEQNGWPVDSIRWNYIDCYVSACAMQLNADLTITGGQPQSDFADYEANYKDLEPKLFTKDKEGRYLYFNEDINDARPSEIPDFDICCGGFPCQPFSVAGLKRGFDDTRGTLFFNIANIVKEKIEAGTPPRVLFLENVRGLKNHDKGNTLKVILATLDELGYGYSYNVLNAKYFGVPQNRERLFIIAWYKKMVSVDEFRFPLGIAPDGKTIYNKEELKEGTMPTRVSDIFEPSDTMDPKFTISDRMWIGHRNRKERNKQNGKGFGYSLFYADSPYTSTISARYWKDGSEILIDQSDKGLNPRTLTPVEAGRLQGYRILGNGWEHPECANNQNYNSSNPEFKIVVSKKEAYHQFGNSVAIPVIKRLAEEIVKQLM